MEDLNCTVHARTVGHKRIELLVVLEVMILQNILIVAMALATHILGLDVCG